MTGAARLVPEQCQIGLHKARGGMCASSIGADECVYVTPSNMLCVTSFAIYVFQFI